MSDFQVGDDIRLTAAFTNLAGTAADPTIVICQVMDPNGDVTSYTYGTDAALIKDSVGNYHVVVDASLAGTWKYRFHSTGTGKAADESTFEVEASAFA